MIDLEKLENHLKKRLDFPYIWGTKQFDDADRKTAFIYEVRSFNELQEKTKELSKNLQNYAYNRWLNFWSAKGVESIFAQSTLVEVNNNVFDKLVDFKINSIPFDHKTSVFPRGFDKNLDYALKHKEELILWFYNNQSQQGRKHYKNRLFVVLYDTQNTQDHWKIKAEIMFIKQKVDNYLENFKQENLIKLNFDGEEVLSDVIWVIKQ